MVETNAPVAVVTGAGSGIGAACARALAREGWSVVIVARRAESLAQVAASGEGVLVPMPADVTDERSVRDLFGAVLEHFGRVDLLFNNAGRNGGTVSVDETSLELWHSVVDTNLTGAFLCTREAFRAMREQVPRGGRIVNNGSVSAHTPRPGSAAYTASKHAITGLTKATALDGRAFDIACGQIDIGNAATPLTERTQAGVLQADGTVAAEPVMDVEAVAKALVYMAGLPLDANVATMTVIATKMPFIGRG